MSHLRNIVLAVLFMGLSSTTAQAVMVQWATGCTSFETQDVLSLAYDTDSKAMTLYKTELSTGTHLMTSFTSSHSVAHFESIPFQGWIDGKEGTIEVEFQTKATMYITTDGTRTQYYCGYYSFE